MELNVKCLINICLAVWLGGGCGPAGLSRAAPSLPMHNATGVHSHCIMHVRGQEAVVADGFFSTRAKIVQITPSGGTNLPFVMCECTQTPVWKRELEKSSIHPTTRKFGKTGRN